MQHGRSSWWTVSLLINLLRICLLATVICKPTDSTVSEESDDDASTEKVETLSDSEEVRLRTVITDKSKMWTDAIVPYEVWEGFDDYNKMKIEKAVELYKKISCVKFVPHTDEVSFVKFMPADKGCSSSVGMVGGQQEIWLHENCFKLTFYRGSVVHEMLHALGFIHEQMRDDRDCYVLINAYEREVCTELKHNGNAKVVVHVTAISAGSNGLPPWKSLLCFNSLHTYKMVVPHIFNTLYMFCIVQGKTLRDLAIMFDTDTSWIYDHRSLMHYKERSYFKGLHGERLGNFRGTLTFWDKMKLNYMYCNGPHYCDLYPSQCEENDNSEKYCRANTP